MNIDYAPLPPKKKKKHRLLKVFCITLIIVVVVAVAGFFLIDFEVNRSGNEDLMGELLDEGETWQSTGIFAAATWKVNTVLLPTTWRSFVRWPCQTMCRSS